MTCEHEVETFAPVSKSREQGPRARPLHEMRLAGGKAGGQVSYWTRPTIHTLACKTDVMAYAEIMRDGKPTGVYCNARGKTDTDALSRLTGFMRAETRNWNGGAYA